ncbi:MAG: sigma-70 family RNA polymerase sigma factor [Planctomycetota bacterium]
MTAILDVSESSLNPRVVLDDLLARTSDGDALALEELWERLAPSVQRVCRRILGDGLDADEAVLDTFEYIWRRGSLFDPERGSARSWVLIVARGRATDRGRRNRTHRGRVVSEPLDEQPDRAETSDPSRTLLDSERHALLDAALDHLPDRQRRLIEHSFIDGQSHSEIARRTGQPLGTVKSTIRRGLARLNAALAPALAAI